MPGKGFTNFIKSHAGSAGIAAAMNAGDLLSADNKLRGMLGTMKDMLLMRATMATGFASLFLMMKTGIDQLVRSTGSLDAALKKLAKVQDLSRAFERLAGNMKKARIEAQLFTDFAKDKNLKFDNVAEAAKNLATFGRGVLGGVQNLNLLNDAAAGTANSLQDTVQAAIAFTEALGSGGDISRAVRNLENMGILSDKTADSFIKMKKAGATRNEMVLRFQQELSSNFAGKAAEEAGTVQGIKARNEAVGKNLKEAFAKDFAEKEAARMESDVALKEAMVPFVGRIGKTLSGIDDVFGSGLWNRIKGAAFAGADAMGMIPAPSIGPDSMEKIQALRDQKNRKGPNTQEEVQAAIDRAAAKRGVSLSEQVAVATSQGAIGAVTRAQNLQSALSRFDELKDAGFDNEQAASGAARFVQAQIATRMGQGRLSLNAQAAVSDLARIGGGGGVEGARAADVANQQLDVQTDIYNVVLEMKSIIESGEKGEL